LVGLLAAVALAILYMLLLQLFPVEMVWLSLISCPVIMFLLSGGCLIGGNFGGALGFGLAGLAFAAFVYCVRDRVEWTAKLFKSVSIIFAKARSIFAVAFLVTFVQCVWLTMCMLALVPFSEKGHNPNGGLMFLMLVSLYWGCQVCVATLHVTCCGVVARSYFGIEVEASVSKSFGLAVTHFFGSICFGSLLIAIIKALKRIVEMAQSQARENGNTAAEVAACIGGMVLSCIESAIQVFNSYAFAIISIYGCPFVQGAREAASLFQSRAGMEMLTNYNLAGMVSLFPCLATGGAVAGLNAGLAWRLGLASSFIGGVALLGFVTGLVILSIVCNMFVSGVESLFICFAKEPLALKDEALQQVFSERQPISK